VKEESHSIKRLIKSNSVRNENKRARTNTTEHLASMNANETYRCSSLCILATLSAISSNVAEIHFVARHSEYFFSALIELYKRGWSFTVYFLFFCFKTFYLVLRRTFCHLMKHENVQVDSSGLFTSPAR